MNKNIYLFALAMILLITTVSALFPTLKETPTLKSGVEISDTANEYPAIEITDWLGLGGTKADLVLTEHTKTCSNDCMSQFQITTYSDSPLVDDVNFYKINDDGSQTLSNIRSYQFYIQTDSKEIEVPDYEYQCINEGISANGTAIQTCKNVQTGSHTEITPEWMPYTIGTEMPSGTYVVKLVGDKRGEWSYDWKIDTQGKTLNEWSVWGSSDDSLLNGTWLYYTLNATTGTAVTTSVGSRTGTISGAGAGSTSWQPAKISNGFTQPKADAYIQTDANIGITGNSPFSINLWVNSSDNLGTEPIFAMGSSGTQDNIVALFKNNLTQLSINYWGNNPNINLPSSLSSFTMLTYVNTGTELKLYSNGVKIYNETRSLNIQANKLYFGGSILGNYAGTFDEIGMWNRGLTETEISNLYNSGAGRTYSTLNISYSSITLNSPANGYISPTNLVTFNATANVVGGSTLTNMSLLIGGVINQTKTISGTTNTTTFNLTLSNGITKNWSIQACDSDGVCGLSENRTVNIDTQAPSITISYPTGTIDGLTNGQTLQLNYTISDTNLGSCWFNYNNVNYTITSCATNTSSNFAYVLGLNSIKVYANDSVGNTNNATQTWNNGLTINSANYNNVTYETSNEKFYLNFSSPIILSANVNLNYNGTTYPSTTTCIGGNCSAYNSLDIPIIASGTQQNKTFYWSITSYNGTGSSTLNSQVYTQQVNQITLTSCNSGTIAVNFTAYDEQNKTRLNPFDFEGSFEYYTGNGGSYKILNVSNSSVSEVDLCINQNTNYYINGIIAYSAPNSTTVYTTRNYFMQGKTINNVMQNINLNLLKSSASTSFILQVQDRYLTAVPQVLVNAQRCYPGIGTNETVFISRTDSNGLTTGNLEAETALYQFFITNYSQTLLSVIPCSKVVPQTSPYTLLFQLGTGYQSPFINIQNITNINQTLVFNQTSKLVTFTYTDTSNEFISGQLIVKSMNYSGNTQPTICSTSSNLTSSILTCNISNSGSYLANAYIYRTSGTSLVNQIIFNVTTFASQTGYYGVFLAFFLILVASFVFKFNEIAGIWSVTIAVVFVNIIQLVDFGNVFITAMICISVLLTAILER